MNEGYLSLLRAHNEAGQAVHQMEIGLLEDASNRVKSIDIDIIRARQAMTQAVSKGIMKRGTNC